MTGLQTSIWNNNLKSILLLVAYPFILAGVVFGCLFVFGFFANPVPNSHAASNLALSLTVQYWPIILTVVCVWFIIAYFLQGVMIRSMSRAHLVTRKEEPDLYNLVENMCIQTGTQMPRIEIIETHARNAFASGIDSSTYCITVTRGLMQSLQKDELEAVLAHELAHILNRDVRLMMVCVVFTGMLGIAAQLLWSSLRYSLWIPRGSNKKQGGGVILLFALLAILWIGYGATLLARFAISRRREFMADAAAVQITKNPDAMMRALLRISGAADIPKAPADLKAMCFENAAPFLGLFATHPPIQDRVMTIAAYSNLPIPTLPPKIRADAPFGRPQELGLRQNWTTRERFPSRRNPNPWG
jgi:heat shock protein HtpX